MLYVTSGFAPGEPSWQVTALAHNPPQISIRRTRHECIEIATPLKLGMSFTSDALAGTDDAVLKMTGQPTGRRFYTCRASFGEVVAFPDAATRTKVVVSTGVTEVTSEFRKNNGEDTNFSYLDALALERGRRPCVKSARSAKPSSCTSTSPLQCSTGPLGPSSASQRCFFSQHRNWAIPAADG